MAPMRLPVEGAEAEEEAAVPASMAAPPTSADGTTLEEGDAEAVSDVEPASEAETEKEPVAETLKECDGSRDGVNEGEVAVLALMGVQVAAPGAEK